MSSSTIQGIGPDGKLRIIAVNADGLLRNEVGTTTDPATGTNQQTEVARLAEIRDRLPQDGRFPIDSPANATRSTYRNSTNTSGVIKNVSGRFFAFTLHNKSTETRWIQLFDSAVTPTSESSCVETHPIFAGAYLILDSNYFGPVGAMFGEGIAFALSATENTYTEPINGTQFHLHVKYL